MHIIVAGTIGAGKSTLSERLSERLQCPLVPEPYEANPYLQDYYADMERWMFHSQVFFLSKLAEQHQQIASMPLAVQDRSIYEAAGVFAYGGYKTGKLSDRDWDLYSRLYKQLTVKLPAPSVLLYLYADPAIVLDRVQARQRTYEQGLSIEFMSWLHELYDDFIAAFDLCPVIQIDSGAVDFRSDNAAIDSVRQMIEDVL